MVIVLCVRIQEERKSEVYTRLDSYCTSQTVSWNNYKNKIHNYKPFCIRTKRKEMVSNTAKKYITNQYTVAIYASTDGPYCTTIDSI